MKSPHTNSIWSATPYTSALLRARLSFSGSISIAITAKWKREQMHKLTWTVNATWPPKGHFRRKVFCSHQIQVTSVIYCCVVSDYFSFIGHGRHKLWFLTGEWPALVWQKQRFHQEQNHCIHKPAREAMQPRLGSFSFWQLYIYYHDNPPSQLQQWTGKAVRLREEVLLTSNLAEAWQLKGCQLETYSSPLWWISIYLWLITLYWKLILKKPTQQHSTREMIQGQYIIIEIKI